MSSSFPFPCLVMQVRRCFCLLRQIQAYASLGKLGAAVSTAVVTGAPSGTGQWQLGRREWGREGESGEQATTPITATHWHCHVNSCTTTTHTASVYVLLLHDMQELSVHIEANVRRRMMSLFLISTRSRNCIRGQGEYEQNCISLHAIYRRIIRRWKWSKLYKRQWHNRFAYCVNISRRTQTKER